MPDGLEARVTELEIRVAYQEDLIKELDKVAREFADRVLVLEEAVNRLGTTVSGMRETGPADEKPPHY